jgi:predicted RNA-binding protein YlxR (DUF448 family)
MTDERRQAAPAPVRGQATDREARTPLRRCVASGRSRPKARLIRFVVDPDGRLVPDLAERLPGRGLWLSAERDMIDRACRRNLFAKAARARVEVPVDLAARLEEGLSRRVLATLGLAKRSGLTVEGFDKVRAWLGAGRAAVLFEASDGAPNGRRRLAAMAEAGEQEVVRIALFDAQSLGQALGSQPKVHVAMAPGALAEALLAQVERLRALRGEPPVERQDGRESSDNRDLEQNDDA